MTAPDVKKIMRRECRGKNGWDIQKIDMGIALCHFYHGARESGLVTDCFVNDPHINVPEGTEYIVSMRIV